MSAMRNTLLLALFFLAFASIECAPFFDALYDAITGNGKRSYGYGSGYGNYGYNYGYNGYGNNGYRPVKVPQRKEKSYKEICRVHYPDAVAFPGAGGIVCPY